MITATEIGRTIGRAIARTTLDPTNAGITREWCGLDGDDGAQLTSAGIEPGTPEWAEAEAAAEAAYREMILPRGPGRTRR